MPSGAVRMDPQAGHLMTGGSSSMELRAAGAVNRLSHEEGESERSVNGAFIIFREHEQGP